MTDKEYEIKRAKEKEERQKLQHSFEAGLNVDKYCVTIEHIKYIKETNYYSERYILSSIPTRNNICFYDDIKKHFERGAKIINEKRMKIHDNLWSKDIVIKDNDIDNLLFTYSIWYLKGELNNDNNI